MTKPAMFGGVVVGIHRGVLMFIDHARFYSALRDACRPELIGSSTHPGAVFATED
jgi:hypothetical protein